MNRNRVSSNGNRNYAPPATSTMKFALAVVCLFGSSAWAFAPASFSTQDTRRTLGSKILSTITLELSNNDWDAGSAVSSYGGGGTFGVDIDEEVASYAGGSDQSFKANEDMDSKTQSSYRESGDDSGTFSDQSGTTTSTTGIATNSDRFGLPEVSNQSHSIIADWKSGFADHQDIGVVLVTQCSIDRLPNLQAQLECWTGKASVAVYSKPKESTLEATNAILSTLNEARRRLGDDKSLDVAVTLVEGCTEGEAYPINYLRNVALLEAQDQHLRFASSLDQSAVLLVDVDFRPSSNLHEMLHTKDAAASILKEGKAVVCPAFESITDTRASSIASLKKLVDDGEAEGFHMSHFPQGHAPTQFDRFWDISLNGPTSGIDDNEYFWNESYTVTNEDLFEPYIAMASADVPLYDERFQGYGLNKISHLASVSAAKDGEYLVLPGVFLVAPTHERSESWGKIYGNPQSDENKRNRMALKDLYNDFLVNLKGGRPPIVSENTRARYKALSSFQQ